MKNRYLSGKLVVMLSVVLLSLSLAGVNLSLTCSVHAEDKPGEGTVDWAQVIEDNKDSDSVESRLLRGIAYANLGLLPEAVKELSIAGDKAYDDEIAGFILDKLNELRHSPDDVLLLNCAAFGSYAFGDLGQAAGYFERIISLEPNNIWTRNFCAFTYTQKGDIDRALYHLEQALKIDRKNQYTHLLLSAAYKEKQQYLMAIYHYLQAPEAVRELKLHGTF